jgi:hypothetical protein
VCGERQPRPGHDEVRGTWKYHSATLAYHSPRGVPMRPCDVSANGTVRILTSDLYDAAIPADRRGGFLNAGDRVSVWVWRAPHSGVSTGAAPCCCSHTHLCDLCSGLLRTSIAASNLHYLASLGSFCYLFLYKYTRVCPPSEANYCPAPYSYCIWCSCFPRTQAISKKNKTHEVTMHTS